MSGFKDIASAYARYAETRDWGKVTRGLIYTCNAGWLDLGHMDTTRNPRMEIGAPNLWSSLLAEGPALRKTSVLDYICLPGVRVQGTTARLVAECPDPTYVTFTDGGTGFFLRYRQDHGSRKHAWAGKERQYLVRYGLTRDQKKSVALAIFMDVSHDFEGFQSGWLGRWLTDSGYSAEDLISNLIGFYVAVGEVTQAEAIDACHPVSRETAERIWQVNGPVGSNKNQTFEPRLFSSYYEDPIAAMCKDDCALTARRFPEKFKSIQPVVPGQDFMFLARGRTFFPP